MMDLKDVKIGNEVYVKEGCFYRGHRGEVLSIFSDYGLDSDVIDIRLLLKNGHIIGDFELDDIVRTIGECNLTDSERAAVRDYYFEWG